jgi:hypothetical protein
MLVKLRSHEQAKNGSKKTDPFLLDPFLLDPFLLDPFLLDPFLLDPFLLDPFLLDPFLLDPFLLDPSNFFANTNRTERQENSYLSVRFFHSIGKKIRRMKNESVFCLFVRTKL